MKNSAFFNFLIVFLGVVAIMGFCFTPAVAQDNDVELTKQVDQPEELPVPEEPEDQLNDDAFGENYQFTWIPCYSFTTMDSDTTYSVWYNYRYLTGSGGTGAMEASINLPSGAFLAVASPYYYDNNAEDISFYIYRVNAPFNQELLAWFTSSGTPGHASANTYPNHTINNKDYMYRVVVLFKAHSDTLGFMGVRLFWKRQISPAPASATFNDVSPGAYYFQGVEALAAANITQGCNPPTNNLFCPNVAVTRAQMAVFLARALGLHWPG